MTSNVRHPMWPRFSEYQDFVTAPRSEVERHWSPTTLSIVGRNSPSPYQLRNPNGGYEIDEYRSDIEKMELDSGPRTRRHYQKRVVPKGTPRAIALNRALRAVLGK